MGRLGYGVRHGDHVDNVLTLIGIAKAISAANAIKADLTTLGIDLTKVKVKICSSQEPRAVQTGGFIAAILGIKFNGGTDERLNPAKGLAAAMKAGHLPESGIIAAWKKNTPKNVESFSDVEERSLRVFDESDVDVVIMVGHGGVLEPLSGMFDNSDDLRLHTGNMQSSCNLFQKKVTRITSII
ncbi:MAG: phosphoglycerate mutase family protein [bacterium]|nr:phosphoglycerate mutase family protein [bacterium]